MNTDEKFHLPVDGILEVFNSFIIGHHQSGIAHPVLSPHHKVPNGSKAGMDIIKTVKELWRRQDNKGTATRRSLSSEKEQVSPDHLLQKPVDLLELGVTRTRNCQRIVVLGAPRVGKTSILRQFLGEEHEERYEPTVEDFYRKLFYIEGEAYQIDLLDAARERDFPAKRRLSILTGDIFLLVFSLDDRDSLNEARNLLSEIKAAKAKIRKSSRPVRVPIVVCGNKSDLCAQRRIRGSEVGEVLGEDVPFFETSSKTGAGLEAAFTALATLGGLPDETSPSRHQIVSTRTYQSLCVGKGGGMLMRRMRAMKRRGYGAPCAAVELLARRPSFTSDLRLVLGSSTKPKKPEVCPIQ